jgi:hypothetical protein
LNSSEKLLKKCSRRKKLLEVARTEKSCAKRCSKVAEHNRDMPNTSNFPHATAMQHFTTIALPSPEKYCGCIHSFKVYYNNACFLLIEAAEIVQPIVNSRPLLDGNLRYIRPNFRFLYVAFLVFCVGLPACHAC